jgi:hypothetical protein
MMFYYYYDLFYYLFISKYLLSPPSSLSFLSLPPQVLPTLPTPQLLLLSPNSNSPVLWVREKKNLVRSWGEKRGGW